MVDLSIIIVNWNGKNFLKKCLASIFSYNLPLSHEVFVVDNGSTDGSVSTVEEEFPQVKLLRNDENLGFARANNQAIRKSQGRYILLLNNDTEIIPGALEGMVEFMDGVPSAGACGGKLFFPNMTHQLGVNVRRFPRLLDTAIELLGIHRLWPSNPVSRKFLMLDDDFDKVLSVDQPAGACLMARKEVVDTVGLLDEEYFILYEDVDWCWRVKKAGWKIYFLPQCRILHYQSGSFKSWARKHWELSNIRSLDYYYRKNRGTLVFFLFRAMLTVNLLVKSLLLIPLLARGANTRDAGGLVFGYLGVCKDILVREKRLGPNPLGGGRLKWHSPQG